jgi:hypothetical protein
VNERSSLHAPSLSDCPQCRFKRTRIECLERGEGGIDGQQMPGHPLGLQMLLHGRVVVVDVVAEEEAPQGYELVQPFRAWPQQFEDLKEPRMPVAEKRSVPQASSSGARRAMCCWLNQSSFSELNTALPPLMPPKSKT